MKRTAKDNKPNLPPVKKIVLSEKHYKLRFAAAVLLLAMAAVSLTAGFTSLLSKGTGWNSVSASSSTENCGEEFLFQYYFEGKGMAASAEYKEVSAAYSEACENAYKLFNAYEEFEGVNNIAYINAHPNEEIEIDTVLYNAFSLFYENENRALFLAPVYEQYNSVFSSATDDEAAEFDPALNGDAADFVEKALSYLNDSEHVNLLFLGENKVKLYVSEEYKSFSDEYGVGAFVDFYRMKNAFITDYIADFLTEKGYTRGVLSSFDGFTRNFDTSDFSYSVNLYTKQSNGKLFGAATLNYSKPLSIVYRKSFKLVDLDDMYIRENEDGTVNTSFIDFDGTSKCALNELVSFSREKSCAEILLKTDPIFVSDEFDAKALSKLSNEKISSVYFDGTDIICNDNTVTFSDIYDDGTVGFALKKQ